MTMTKFGYVDSGSPVAVTVTVTVTFTGTVAFGKTERRETCSGFMRDHALACGYVLINSIAT